MADVNGLQQHEEDEDNENCNDSGKDHFFNGLETLVVDNILDSRETKTCRQYLVSFKSWIAEDYLQDYNNLLQIFWNQKTQNKDNNDDENRSFEVKDGQNGINDGHYTRKDDGFDKNVQDEDRLDDGSIDDEYEKEEKIINIESESYPEENFERDSEELLPSFRATENGADNYDQHENSLAEEDKENDDMNNITSSTSSESLEVSILKDNPSKKRKLKTLDDIVRKITKSNDGIVEPHYNNEEDLSGRLFTLDQTLSEEIKEEEERMTGNIENRLTEETTKNGVTDSNVYWSGGKAYQKSGDMNGEKRNSEEKSLPSSSEKTVKSRQRYQKCRFCSTLYSDPALLERHENSHFVYKSRHGIPFHEGIPPPPLVPVAENRREFPQYQHEGKISPKKFLTSPKQQQQQQQQQQVDESSIVRKPIRNLLSKLYENDSKEKYEQSWLSPNHIKRSPSPGNNQNSPTNHPEENKPETTCPLCKRRFDNFENFELHFENQHPGVSKFVCKICYKVFLNHQHYEAHSHTHTELDYVCRLCHKSFDRKDEYEAHIITHSQEKSFCCHICGRSFSLRTNLRRHLLVHSDVTPYFCHTCGVGFRRPETLSAHMKDHHLTTNGHADSHVKHQRVEGDSPIYPTIYERRHSDGHHNGSLHTSPRQIEHSPSRSSNASHDSNEHQHYEPVKMLPPPARYYKEQNPASYPYDASFSPNNPHSKYKASTKSSHMVYREGTDPNMFYHQARSHSNEVYDTAHHMKMQQRKRRTYSPIKPSPMKMAPPPSQAQHHVTTSGAFECLKCGEKFSSPSLYDIHVQSHKEVFECEKCHKSFAVRSQYDVHMQSHDNSKSHKCPYCHRSFSMKGNLRRHIRIHTNEAPYECPICFQRFRRSDGLKGHIKRHETLGESAPTDLLPSQAS